jgi:Bacterial regulatory proteins, gntR family
VSDLFRTQGWMTIAQLTRSWGNELAKDRRNPRQNEQDLVHILLEDVINDRLDDSGPLCDGRRLGLRLITPEHKGGLVEGKRIHDLIQAGMPISWVLDYTMVMKEAALDFARRRQLPPPSWWGDAAIDLQTAPDGVSETAPALAGDVQNVGSLRSGARVRPPRKLEKTKQAIREDIAQSQLTVSQLDSMIERELSEKYGVSRDTARKARNAVLSELSRST